MKKQRNTALIYKTAIMILPIGVVIGTAVFMWMYYVNHVEEKKEQAVIAAPGIRLEDLDDMVGKFTDLIGPRTPDTEQGRVGMRRAAAMIEGRLGPQNVGYQVKKGAGKSAHGMLWKSLWVEVPGTKSPEQVVVAVVSYAGAGDQADANTVSTMMMVASSLARAKPEKTIRIVFLPYDLEPAEQTDWVKSKCIGEDEELAYLVGIRSVPLPEGTLPSDGWTVIGPAGEVSPWLDFMNVGGQVPASGENAIWLSHFVFFNGNYQEAERARLRATLRVAEQLRNCVLALANGSFS